MNATYKHKEPGKAVTGTILVIAGVLLMASQWGMFLPAWVLSWPMLLIAIGVSSAARHGFRKPGSYFLILVGGFFLLKRFFFPGLSFAMVWPLILIACGAWIVFSTDLFKKYS